MGIFGCVKDTDKSMAMAHVELGVPKQPELDPNAWFLSGDEITISRDGIVRTDLQHVTTGNHTRFFPTTDVFFNAVYDDLEATKGAGDVIWINGWSIDLNVPLRPTSDKVEDTRLRKVLERAVIGRGVQVRVLVWTNAFDHPQVVAARDFVNGLNAKASTGAASFLFDDRVPHPMSMHHQKSIVIKRNNDLVAYIGGIDLTRDRWDTMDHRQAQLRVTSGAASPDGPKGWIDGAMRVHGAAAQDIAANFVARWNSSNKPCRSLKDDRRDFENPSYKTLAVIHHDKALAIPHDGTSTIQIVRTYSPKYQENGGYADIAPYGESSLLDARIKAIRNAKNFIYIEDQYFFHVPKLLDALMEVLPRISMRVVVVTQRPTVTINAKTGGCEKLVYKMAKPLLDAFPTKFFIYTTRQPLNVYVNAKILIVDDVFLSIGSANWTRRCMTSDAEIGANIVDTKLMTCPKDKDIQVSERIRQFRLQRIQEKTTLAIAKLEDMSMLDSLTAMETATSDGAAIIEALAMDKHWKSVEFASGFTREMVDPDDLEDFKQGENGENLLWYVF